MPQPLDKKTLKVLFANLDAARQNIRKRFRECAAYTIPTVLPRINIPEDDEVLRPYQSVGDVGANNISSKLVTIIFPASAPWFMFAPGASIVADIRQNFGDDGLADALKDIVDMLYKRQKKIERKLNSTRYRVVARTALDHYVVLGNKLSRVNDDYSVRVYGFDQYVQKRASDGTILYVITLDKLSERQLTDEQKEKAKITPDQIEAAKNDISGDKTFDLYTRCDWNRDGSVEIVQELNDHEIVHSEEPVSPFIPVGHIQLPDEDWSRGYCEGLLGDLRTFNGLNKSILDGIAMAVKFIPVFDPTNAGEMQPEDLMKPNGQVIIGRVVNGEVQGVAFLQSKKAADVAMAVQQAAIIERRLGKAFLLETEAQRDAERVTATEVMRVASQLEGALGSIFVQFADEWQRPFLDRTIYQMEKDKLLEPISKKDAQDIDTLILTGLEALGNQQTLEKLFTAVDLAIKLPSGPERIKWDEVVKAGFKGMNLEVDRFVMSEEEYQEKLQATMQQQVAMQEEVQRVETTGKIIEQGAAAAAQQQQPS